MNVLTLAYHVQAQQLDQLRDGLDQPRAAKWFREWWTGLQGSWTLAHAGYAGSNNNMGVKVDWRDIKRLVPPSTTLATFAGALVKNIKELGIEHCDFLCQQDQPNLFPSVPKQLKSMYDLMQDLHPKKLSCAAIVMYGQGRPW